MIHPREHQHRWAKQRTMKPSSIHHHHNGLMTTTPPSELKFQGIISSQTRRQAEPASRSSIGLMQWPSAMRSIASRHRCKEEKLTSASGPRREKLTSEECRRDVEERVTSAWADEAQHIQQQEPSREDEPHGILQQKSSWADEAHQSIAFWSAIANFTNGILAMVIAHLSLIHTTVPITLLHLHQVWPVHPGSLLDFRLLLYFLLVHLALLSVLG